MPQLGTFGSHKALESAIGWYDIDTIVYLVNKGFCLSQDILKKEPHFYWGRDMPRQHWPDGAIPGRS